jgi:glutamate-ammonia-ligase adenylyltransferase
MSVPPTAAHFRDFDRAQANLDKLAAATHPGSMNFIRVLIASSPDPDGALDAMERFLDRQPEAFRRIVSSTSGLQYLVTVFSYSRFLTEEILRRPDWFETLPGAGHMFRMLNVEEVAEQLEHSLDPGVPSPLRLTQFRRRRILRILLRDALGLATLSEITEELSGVADALLEVSYQRIRKDLIARYGVPLCIDSSGKQAECGFSILALGKLGGRELNYSSDIDLMFVYTGNGETSGPNSISNKEFFKKAATQLTDLLSTYTAEGRCYRVDLRLRPDGTMGEVCISLDGARNYYQERARDWELQMLIKARIAAGEHGPARELLELIEPLIYSTTLDFSAVEAVSLTRERIHEKIQSRRHGEAELDVKLARGGIRDIEFLVQCLQRMHGGREPWVRHGGTLLALFRLRDKDLLSVSEYSRLASAYQFLRNLEHRLQFIEDRQTHTLPRGQVELELLARRMPAADIGADNTAEGLLRRLNLHLEEVQEIYERVIHAQKPVYYATILNTAAPEVPGEPPDTAPTISNLLRFLDQKAPELGAQVQRQKLNRGAHHFELFLEKVLPQTEWLERLNRDQRLTSHVLEIFEYSPYFSEQLVRTPELLSCLVDLGASPAGDPDNIEEILESVSDMRRHFRREMFRIQSESICLQRPIFTTLGQTSDLGDAMIRTAYSIAFRQVVASRPPLSDKYQPRDQMRVVTLGRLGMREFDLGSDADIVFILPDRDASEIQFWTRVAERLIDLLTAYTGEGVMFAVDTRLRPNGREGALVQQESAYRDYFANKAEAWEGITYMKSRTVAGDLERGTEFLNELQEIDWRRYGQSGRSLRDLRRMRLRLEKEQGGSNPLKAGLGGYYDIDFGLMYLRLKSAGIFFKVLNTPARIDVIEKMGHLERADAAFLRDAATFYRAVDHGLRLISGHTEGTLPRSGSQLDTLTALAARWMPDHLHDQPLPDELLQIQARTREFFDRIFGT